MNVLIVYDSIFGNTERLARVMGEACGGRNQVQVLHVSEATPDQVVGADVLIVGSPTRGFRPTPAVKLLLKRIPHGGLKGVRTAAFDTRFPLEKMKSAFFLLPFLVRVFGYAAGPMAEILEKRGGEVAVPPEGFFVEGVEGPLVEGEIERAEAWVQAVVGAGG
ncbi:flavodoxin/nitric oxide synthase [Spirochaeta thermophila DSM 6578]|uniref:Flavodoxin/nitric oxide synthase n=1 Tax=Winmispira thermophila (strain ATCC 700085 / DSM 6578 / Z-1203) TaxID=869211 RepID=G0GAL2_WINT7|nr:flavodoxin family protein [Spirochaeta thermophila]AEJ60977.1 flavodoxin/nitric oxide synthase [Spirochaeta thermophila DSM 6578]